VSLQQSLIDLAIVSLLAALAPIVSGLLARRVPQVVILLVGGILIGPQVLGWADPAGLKLVSNVGLGFLSCWRAMNSSSGCSASGLDGWHSSPGW
jgi:Kef-type K+ transport system membrane component KefB